MRGFASRGRGGGFGVGGGARFAFGRGARFGFGRGARFGFGRGARWLSTLLMVAGVLVLADVVATLVWQEPLSALYTHIRQGRLAGDLRALERVTPTQGELLALERSRTDSRLRSRDLRARLSSMARLMARDEQRKVAEGGAIGRILIPRIGADFVVVKGTSVADLHSGPGVYPQTGFPGVPGTTAIAGHRTTYLAPFRHIDTLRRGDRIVLQMPYGRFTYSVQYSRVVAPNDVGVIAPVGYSRLVLSACTPLFSAAQRIVVFARLQAEVVRGAAV